MKCSKCGRTLEAMGQFGGVFSPAASIHGAGNPSDFDMWRAQVCSKCRLAFCGDCLELGGPTPCPECGNPTEPAYRGTVNAMGQIRRLAGGVAAPAAAPDQESPKVSSEEAEIENFRRLVKSRVNEDAFPKMTPTGLRLVLPKEKEETVEREVSQFRTIKDPLFRSIRYRQWLIKGVIEKEDIAGAVEHLVIGVISDQLTRSQLTALIQEFEVLRGTMATSELAKRQFIVKKGWFRKPYKTTGTEIEQLLPKLRLLVESPIWKSR